MKFNVLNNACTILDIWENLSWQNCWFEELILFSSSNNDLNHDLKQIKFEMSDFKVPSSPPPPPKKKKKKSSYQLINHTLIINQPIWHLANSSQNVAPKTGTKNGVNIVQYILYLEKQVETIRMLLLRLHSTSTCCIHLWHHIIEGIKKEWILFDETGNYANTPVINIALEILCRARLHWVNHTHSNAVHTLLKIKHTLCIEQSAKSCIMIVYFIRRHCEFLFQLSSSRISFFFHSLRGVTSIVY